MMSQMSGIATAIPIRELLPKRKVLLVSQTTTTLVVEAQEVVPVQAEAPNLPC